MPFSLPTFNTGGSAPVIEDGLALARFEDLLLKEHPDWAGTDQYGKDDNGQRYHFLFAMLDEDGAVMYDPNSEGDPLELEATTRTATGEKSNFFALMSGLLTKVELAAYQEATADAPFDGSVVQGRVYNVKVSHNKKGWPFIEQVISIAKVKAAK